MFLKINLCFVRAKSSLDVFNVLSVNIFEGVCIQQTLLIGWLFAKFYVESLCALNF
jgi:hypothetical protein